MLNDAVGLDKSVKLAWLAAVVNPFALTVTLVNVPTLLFTVAKVPAAVTLAEPLNDGLV